METLIDFALKKFNTLNVRNVMIAWSSGRTLRKFLEKTKDLNLNLNIVTVTNPKGGTMGGRSVSISDETREELEKKGIKVVYLNDDLDLGEPMAPTPQQKLKRNMLLPWMPFHIDPLSLDVGVDLSILFSISQGYRVAVGCLVLAVRNGFIPKGERVLCFSGAATGLICDAGLTPRTCYVKEILGFERNSDFSFQNQAALKRMVAITKR